MLYRIRAKYNWKSWYLTCECANGLRTVGCCLHFAAITYYLTYARYLSRIVRPAEALIKLFNVEKGNPVINDDSDED